MSKKRMITTILLLILMVVLDYMIITVYQLPKDERTVNLSVIMESDVEQTIQIYYLTEDDEEDGFSEDQMVSATYEMENTEEMLTFTLPAGVRLIRLDFAAEPSANMVSGINVEYKEQVINLDLSDVDDLYVMNDIANVSFQDVLMIETEAGDPYLAWDISEYNVMQMVRDQDSQRDLLKKILLCISLDIVFAVALRYAKLLWALPKEWVENRKLIFSLSKNDFKTKYAGSYLGIFWAFVQPVVTVVLYWFVFEKGLRAGGVNTRAGITVPYVLWLIAGLVPWFLFQDSWNGGTNALIEYSYLVKKVVFKISILPIIKIISALFVHVFFVAFMLVMYLAMGMGIHLSYIQIIYFSICVFALSLGLSYAASSIAVFFRDLTQVIGIVLQVGTWLTPIMWNFDGISLPPLIKYIFMMNPMYYVVQGYRLALIDHGWFWQMPVLTAYFWGFVLICFVVGSGIFRRLQVHFADVL